MIIIVVFDPLAILLLVASNQTYRKLKENKETPTESKKAIKKKKIDNSTAPSVELFTKDDNEVIPKSKIVNIGEMP